MRTRVSQWGNSLAVRLSRAHAQELGVTKGSAIEISVEGDTLVVRKSRYDLRALLARVTPDNLHGETDTGRAMGREEW